MLSRVAKKSLLKAIVKWSTSYPFGSPYQLLLIVLMKLLWLWFVCGWFWWAKVTFFFPEQISFRFVKYAGQHMCVFMRVCVFGVYVCNKHSLWVGWKTTWCVYSIQHVQLIILKVFFFKEGLGCCSKAIVQIQRRKYSFEKK